MTTGYRELSLWFDTLGEEITARPALAGDLDVDVAIVGAGYTGLWTAYYLAKADPSLRIAVLEREIAGFGASGRNGGWCSALFPASLAKVARDSTRERAIAQQRAMNATVDEVGRVVAEEGIDCDFTKGGTVVLARTPVQLARAREAVAGEHAWGFDDTDTRLLDADEARSMVGATDVLGGTYTPHCAVIHPAKLARGLAAAVAGLGVSIYENTPVTAIADGVATTAHGRVRADVVVRATEGYTPELAGFHRDLAPVYSLMIATEPLPSSFWAQAGLARRESFSDMRHLIIYGQRTADDRLAFGGRGAPYHFGSRVKPEFDRDEKVFAELRRVITELFPAVADARVTHTWGGPLGVARDWYASCGVDRARRLAWAGGYVGDGVGTANLAGRTLADLIRDEYTDLTRLPWVRHRSPKWEPEPLRWIGTNVGLRVMSGADVEEQRTGKESRLAQAFGRFVGH
ncbi:FAD-dependent oxidoreductase [Streptomyces sp. SID3343]|uniref:NAD(P)/FAD-dependent oxidoreductase n=1 Tax=Streptomyces sp. SID3343 TaxID=2690260 RepID=UPI00136B278F|nr:FAD-dependent oxidoreductase [Streptomyces sp. SID3343]MYW05066.1 FAD-dependent oxidoreductase [Streptomyces sp. SID3343]